AERAVRTGLALTEAVGKVLAQEPLQVRIGVATGLVVVGDLVGSGEAQERGVVGETPNLAARLQAAAPPCTIVIGPRATRLTTQRFEAAFHYARPHYLISLHWSGESFHLDAAEIAILEQASQKLSRCPLVGREEEIELLLRRWSRAKSGEGQAVLLSGEA